MEFTYKDKKYTYIPFTDFNTDMLPKAKAYKQSKYLDLGCGFDIETSRIGAEKLSTMYVWQFAIKDITIIGRTWEEFQQLLQRISKHYKLDKKHKILCFVHNLSFEWQFIKGQLSWAEEFDRPAIFATDDRKIIKATTDTYIEFRDSYILTQMSLDKLAKNYNLSIQKLKEDTGFSYDLARNCMTELTEEELAYCINDVQILSEFYYIYVKREFIAKQHKIPLTSTGIVREEMARSYKRQNKKWKKRYENMLRRSFPSFENYKLMITWLFRGGFTHSNCAMTDIVFNSFTDKLLLGAEDIKSSYPASLLHYKFPLNFVERDPSLFYTIGFDHTFINEFAYYGTFIFHNIQAKSTHSIESRNKLMEYSKCDFDNGRLIGGEYIKVMLNDIDMLNYKDFYTWESVECLDFHTSKKVDLPTFVKDLILQYYYYKETEKDKYLRTLTKYKLNSIYGCMVSGLLHESLVYNPETQMFENTDNNKSYEEIISKEILLPQWGIWCTSYSRRAVLVNILKIGPDAIYSDTDSIKYLDQEGHKWVFDTYNDKMRRINNNMYVGKFDRDIFSELGCFEDDTEGGRIIKFKTLGAKRYVYTTITNGKLKDNVTIAGMRKGSLQQYCEDKDIDIYQAFRNNLRLSEDESMKLTTCYEDAAFERDFTDYQGHTVRVKEKSCVTLYPIPFNMKLTSDYIELLSMQNKINNRRLVKRRL